MPFYRQAAPNFAYLFIKFKEKSQPTRGFYQPTRLFETSLVTQPMLQRGPNCTELSYIQILCRFQKCERVVPPP